MNIEDFYRTLNFQYDNCQELKIININYNTAHSVNSLIIPGTPLGFSYIGLNPNEYCGLLSLFDFSGQ